MRVQMRALFFLAVLTTGITAAMERVEKAVATALNLTGASQNALPLWQDHVNLFAICLRAQGELICLRSQMSAVQVSRGVMIYIHRYCLSAYDIS